MRAGPLTGWAAQLINAKIAFGSFDDWRTHRLVKNESTILIPHIDHANVVVRARVGASRAANTSIVVYYHLT